MLFVREVGQKHSFGNQKLYKLNDCVKILMIRLNLFLQVKEVFIIIKVITNNFDIIRPFILYYYLSNNKKFVKLRKCRQQLRVNNIAKSRHGEF